MGHTLEAGVEVSPEDSKCDNCGRILEKGLRFSFEAKSTPGNSRQFGNRIKCFVCALSHWPMVKRSGAVAVVVGTALTLLNQGDILFSGGWITAFYWKIPLTYCVPFLVATYGALANSRQ